jgi:hypothetical protein
MAPLPPPNVKYFPESSLEKQCYNIAEKYIVNIPITNDRNRLGYNLYKYMSGEGDVPEILVKSIKIKIVGITGKELAEKISADLAEIKK